MKSPHKFGSAGAAPIEEIRPSKCNSRLTCNRLLKAIAVLSLGCGPVSLFDCVSFADILALLGRAVKTRALFVINVCLGIDPHQPVSAAWCRSRGAGASGGRRCGRRRLTELLGLNKSPRWNLPGDADAVGLVAGLTAASVFAFLRVRFAFRYLDPSANQLSAL
jgi:hypothetical protein